MKIMIHTTVLAVLLVLAGCGRDPYGGVKTDVGPSLHEMGRPAIWHATHMPLGDSGFTAAAGPGRYQDEDDDDWDYYSIDIEKRKGKMWHLFSEGAMTEASYVFFSRDLEMKDVPTNLVHKKVGDIVTYDETARRIVFTIGTNRYSYTLPNR